ncbi:MAG: toll/interleukin-1 receptor domain-containing protein [Anaerolineae bacterium]|nr:toll/interleukin-1 receptor domain-containing protein [Anaerolineae bacterium]
MDTADQMITLLREASVQSADARVREPFEALMGQLAANLVGEPLADGVVTDTEWVLLNHSLRQFSRSPRSTAAWSDMRRQAATLKTALDQSKADEAQAAIPQASAPASAPPAKRSLRPAWLTAFARNRAAQPVTVSQHIETIQNSHDVNLVVHLDQSSVLDVDDSLEDDTAPAGQNPSPTSICDIFLSYSRRDARLMRRVRADLRAEGFAVWTDENLKPGTPSWMHGIEDAIGSAMCIIVLLSPDSRKSEWVEKELSTAKIHRKQIIPLLVRGDERTALPILLSNTQYADVRTEADYKRRMRDLTRVLHNLKRGAEAAV